MVKRTMTWLILTVLLVLSGAASAAGPGTQPPGERAASESIVGGDLMSGAERAAHRERLRNAGSAEEVERIQAEHRERMRQRAAEHGIALPEEPRVRGSRMRPGEAGSGSRQRDGGR